MAAEAQEAGRAWTSTVTTLAQTRRETLALVAELDAQALERVHSPLMSPLVWDLGHIAAYEDLWLVHRLGHRPLLRGDLARVYDAFESPRASRGGLPYLCCDEVFGYMDAVRERTLQVLEARGEDPLLHEMVLRHEQQHTETMLQTMQLARLDPRPHEPPEPPPPQGGGHEPGLELVEVPAGPCTIGAPRDCFAYDNERPRHCREVPGFLIGRAPITNASYLSFVEGGGYDRREWWSDEGWAWKEEYDIARPGGWSPELSREWRLGRLVPLHPGRPVTHISWYEADAFTRAHGMRLPTEQEWEKAASWDQAEGRARRYPWGEGAALPGRHANLDQRRRGPAEPAASAQGASPCGALAMLGDVWEWTSSDFSGYAGFAAHPYREYSEVFFNRGYKVLRGASWATRARCACATFRNWDLPQRRQIFSGLRAAKDLS